MNPTRYLFFPFAVLLIFSGQTDAMSPGSALKKLRKRYRSVATFRADFREVFEWAMTGETTIRSGKLLITKDNRFRIDTPEQLLIADGRNVYRYNRMKKQVIIESISDDSEQLLPRKMMLNFADEFKAITITDLVVDGRAGFRLDLEANDPDASLVSSANVWATTDDLTVHRLKFIDLNSNSTTYFLSDISFDQPVDSSETSFTPPEGVELFDLR